MEESDVRRWVDRYVTAWNSNDRDDIAALFTDDARYFTEPYAAPWTGREEIVRNWLANRDEPGETSFEYRVVAVDGDLGIVRGETTYKNPPRVYSNLWEVRLDDDGRAREFVEWWMKH